MRSGVRIDGAGKPSAPSAGDRGPAATGGTPARGRLGFSTLDSDHAGAKILAYLLNLQFGRIPIDIVATGVQTD